MTRLFGHLVRRPPPPWDRLAATVRRGAFWLALGLPALSPGLALAAPGDLDLSFDVDGKVTIDHGLYDVAYAMLVQPDAKIVVAGVGFPGLGFAVSRLNPDGSADRGFGTAGSVAVDFGPDCRGARAAALQPDGKIVIAGSDCGAIETHLALARLRADGSLDADFGQGGKLTIDSGGNDYPAAVFVRPDGKLLIVAGGGGDLALTRLNPDGSFDPSFGGDGIVTQDFGARDYAWVAALQPDGRLVAAGSSSVHDNVLVTRLNAGGSLDRRFSSDGRTTIDYGGDDYPAAVLVQPDGKIVVAGQAHQVWEHDAITRLNPDGSLDGGFGGHGNIATRFGFGHVLAAALEPGGRIVVGAAMPTGPGRGDAVVMRLRQNGKLDRGFGAEGRTAIDYSGGASRAQGSAYAVTLQPDGKILAGGGVHFDANRGGIESNFAIARLEGGEPSPALGPSGAVLPRCAGRSATIVGSAARDVLLGTSRADVIVGLAGNDRIRAGRGKDLVCAGPGDDSVRGGAGRDRLLGQGGRDRLLGGSGDDLLDGGHGNDLLLGQGGWDRLLGRKGRDKLAGGSGRDGCAGNAGRDRASCERGRSL